MDSFLNLQRFLAIQGSPVARRHGRAGVTDASIESIPTRRTSGGLTGQEAIVARFVHEMLRDKRVSDESYAAAQGIFGDRGVVDLTLTVSYYSAVALAPIALKLEMEPGRVSTL
jgi:4-carboxymuconolactone decarboxylase